MEPDVVVLRLANDSSPDIAWRPGHRDILVVQQPVEGRPSQVLSVKNVKPMAGAARERTFEGQPQDRHNGGMFRSRDGEMLHVITAK